MIISIVNRKCLLFDCNRYNYLSDLCSAFCYIDSIHASGIQCSGRQARGKYWIIKIR